MRWRYYYYRHLQMKRLRYGKVNLPKFIQQATDATGNRTQAISHLAIEPIFLTNALYCPYKMVMKQD